MQHGGDSTLLRLLAGGPSGFDANGELCILEGRLYLASLRRSPVAVPNKYYITLTQKMRYVPYCADFGPFNLGECTTLRKPSRNCGVGGRRKGLLTRDRSACAPARVSLCLLPSLC